MITFRKYSTIFPFTAVDSLTVVQQIGFSLEFSLAEGARKPLNFLVLFHAVSAESGVVFGGKVAGITPVSEVRVL